MREQGLPPPILADERKEPMLNFVPFTGPGWEMADRDGESALRRKALQFPLPQPHPRVIAPLGSGALSLADPMESPLRWW